MKKILLSSIKVLVLMTIITGFIYPLLITAAGLLFFNQKAEGSIIYAGGKAVGSVLIGQQFVEEKYFHSRPSAIAFNPLPSGGSNLGPTSKALRDSVKNRGKIFLAENISASIIPVEMLFASGSGVDPHISPESAFLQIDRIAKARNFNEDLKNKLIYLTKESIEKRQFGFLGEERINVLLLNIQLDKLR